MTGNSGRFWSIESAFTVPPVPGLSVVNVASLRAYHIWEQNTITDGAASQMAQHLFLAAKECGGKESAVHAE